MLFGINNSTIDILSNPYFVINVGKAKYDGYYKDDRNKFIHKCNKEYVSHFIKGRAIDYYPNSVCFDDYSQVPMKSNWHEDDFYNLYFIINPCNQNEYFA